ncbi:MAG: methyltransferase domain-containing protein [Gammaproteobacteria bacterium]
MKPWPLSTRCVKFCLALVLALNVAQARDTQLWPDINLPFVAPDFEQWVARFESPGREIYARRLQIVAASGVTAGMTVADIGAGTGLFTRLFSERVGAAGKVYALDISKVFVDNIVRISRELGQDNVEGIVNAPDDVGLPPRSLDLAFICDTYHHFEDPATIMQSIQRALKPDGRLIVIDFRKVPGVSTPWLMQHVRAGEQEVVREIEAAGFRLIEDNDLLATNYFLRFGLQSAR